MILLATVCAQSYKLSALMLNFITLCDHAFFRTVPPNNPDMADMVLSACCVPLPVIRSVCSVPSGRTLPSALRCHQRAKRSNTVLCSTKCPPCLQCTMCLLASPFLQVLYGVTNAPSAPILCYVLPCSAERSPYLQYTVRLVASPFFQVLP